MHAFATTVPAPHPQAPKPFRRESGACRLRTFPVTLRSPMTPEDRPVRPAKPSNAPEPEPGRAPGAPVAGLHRRWRGRRLRLALGARHPRDAGRRGRALLLAWLSGVAFVAVLIGPRARRVARPPRRRPAAHHGPRALRTGRVSNCAACPRRWLGRTGRPRRGDQSALSRLRTVGHAAEEIEQLRGQLAAMQLAADRWLATETWEAPSIPARSPN